MAPNDIELFPPQLHFPPLASGQRIGILEHHVLGLNFKDGPENTVHVFTLPDSSMGARISGRVYRSSFMALPGVYNIVFIDERAMNGEDATLPFTFGHEIGHVLGNGHPPCGQPQTVPTWNLMHACGPVGEREHYEARKRLNQSQVIRTREESGPGSDNPILQQN